MQSILALLLDLLLVLDGEVLRIHLRLLPHGVHLGFSILDEPGCLFLGVLLEGCCLRFGVLRLRPAHRLGDEEADCDPDDRDDQSYGYFHVVLASMLSFQGICLFQ